MHPLVPYFEPPAIPIGPLTIHGFGILVALGFWLGSAIAQQKAARFGGSPDAINRLIIYLVAGTFIGGHLGHILFYDPEVAFKDPVQLLKVWQGLSSFGGFVVCVPLTIWFFREEKLDWWRHADALAFGFTLGWFFGRMGCFVAHDHPGTQTNFWLGVYGMCPGRNASVACHDLGLYEAIWSIAVFGIFQLLDTKPRAAGFYVALLAMLYGPLRFVADYFRNPDIDTRYYGLTPAQYGSIVVTILGIWMVRQRLGAAAAVRTEDPSPSGR
jgi:phosphatidylglycerol:prolipoprotein diacylglycerol transferase